MNNTDFMNMYDDYLAHRWVTSKDKAKAEAQKRAETEYNKEYYRKHHEEIQARQRARRSVKRTGRLLTPDEALSDLNKRQRQIEKQNFDNSMAGQIYQNRIKAYVAQGMSEEDAKKQVNSERLSAQAEQMDVDRRNAIARRTARAQGENIRASEAYKKQQAALRKRSESDTKASNAQMEAAERRRATSQTTEAKIKRSIDKAAKRVSNVVNGAKASVQKAKDYYSNTSASISRISDFTKKTINKYFG